LNRFLTCLTCVMTIASLSVSACASVPATQTIAPGGATSTVQQGQPATKEPIAALVNGQGLPLAALEREITRRLEGIRSVGDPLPADQAAFRVAVLDSMIDQMLIEQAAAIQGVKVTDADVENEVQANIKIAGSQEKWQAQLAADHMSEADYRVGIRSALITQKMRDIVTSGIGNTAEQVHARHILVADEATAKQVEDKLKAGGDFAQLAAQYSLDVTTKQTGGDLGWFSRGQLLQKTVEDSAFALAANQISAPVKSDLGYHIIQTLERVKDRPIDAQTRYRLTEEAFERWIQSLVKGARIEKFPNGRA
jgi:foldase protein PrsA